MNKDKRYSFSSFDHVNGNTKLRYSRPYIYLYTKTSMDAGINDWKNQKYITQPNTFEHFLDSKSYNNKLNSSINYDKISNLYKKANICNNRINKSNHKSDECEDYLSNLSSLRNNVINQFYRNKNLCNKECL